MPSKFNTEEIVDMYVNQRLSSVQIADILHCSARSVLNKLEEAGVDRRSLKDAQYNHWGKDRPAEFDSYEKMYDLYVTQRKTKDELGRMFGVSPGCVGRELNRLGIHVRDDSESKIGTRNGSEHHNWRGGISALSLRLREYYQVNLAPSVRRRDGFRCQLCGTSNHLHTHHIRPFSEIVREICDENPDLDPMSDINELYDIITNDDRFTDLDNLITYCKNCHLFKIHKYQKSISNEAS